MSTIDPVVFMSYCQEADVKEWLVALSDKLWGDNIEALMDAFMVDPGGNFQTFMEKALRESHKILVICTPEYCRKADGRIGGVGYEVSLINNELAENIAGNKKVIPILLRGTRNTSIPALLRPFRYIDFTKEELFEKSYEELTRAIYEESYYKRGAKGKKPEFKEREISTGFPVRMNATVIPALQPPKGFSLDRLESLLSAHQFKEADMETLYLFRRYFHKERELFKHEFVREFPQAIFDRIDSLWRKYSNEKFGFSRQFEIWKELGGYDYSFGVFEKFINEIGWARDNRLINDYASLSFDLSAPDGHLPSLKQHNYEKADRSIAWTDNFKSFLSKQLNK